jgi:DNA-directed RNA polymerase subunit alpha
MSETATVDVLGVLEKSPPVLEEVLAARDAASRDPESHKRAQGLVSSMPSDVAAAADDKALALKKGLALWVVGREADAAEWLRHATSKIARIVRGRCLVACGNPATGLEVLKDVAEDPSAVEATAEAHANLGDVDAVKKLLDAVEKAGGAATGLYFRGRIAELEGEREEADRLYREALDADPEHAGALFRSAYREYTFGDEDQAVELYVQCLESPRPPMNAYLNLGNIYEDRGELSKALDCYNAVIEADPTNSRARLFRGDAIASLNMFYDEDLERRADRRSQVLRLPVTDFELSVRSRNCLAKMGVRTLGDLVQRTEQELLSYKNFGETSLQEIKDILAQKGLRLGMGREEVARDEQARTILESIGGGEADRRKLLAKPLTELELSVRSRHCMNVLGLKTVGDLCERSEPELMTIKNFGQTSLNEVKQKLAELGLSLKAGEVIPGELSPAGDADLDGMIPDLGD